MALEKRSAEMLQAGAINFGIIFHNERSLRIHS